MVTPFLLDCDTGRDDALAIWYALSNKMPLWGVIASYGNTPLDNVVTNCQKVLAAFPEQSIPVIKGAIEPSRGHKYYDDVVCPRQDASGNGLCNIDLPYVVDSIPVCDEKLSYVQQIIDLIKSSAARHGGMIDYVITGPATNFAAVCEKMGDDIHNYIDNVVMMGGKFGDLWAKLPFADFNIGCDPYALQTVLDSKLDFKLVPMNATWPIFLGVEDVEALSTRSALSEQAKSIMVAHCRSFSPEPVFRFHDPAVMVALQNKDLFVAERYKLCLDEEADNFGQLQTDGDGTNIALFQYDASLTDVYLNELLTGLGLRLAA